VGESIVNESIAKYGSSNCGDSLRKLSGEMWDKLNDDKLERASKKKKDTTILPVFNHIHPVCSGKSRTLDYCGWPPWSLFFVNRTLI
jgi:hypothetical protein